MTTVDDDLRREIDELVQSAEAWLDSIGRRVTAEHADRANGYAQAAADIGRRIFEALDPFAQARLLERAASIITNLTLLGTGSFAGRLNEFLQECRRVLADPTVEERDAVALVLLAKMSAELGGVCPACASERRQRALDLDPDEQRCRMIAARVEANWPTDVDPNVCRHCGKRDPDLIPMGYGPHQKIWVHSECFDLHRAEMNREAEVALGFDEG